MRPFSGRESAPWPLLELFLGRRKGSRRVGSLRGVTGSHLVACRVLSASFRVAHGSRIPLDVTASQPSRKSCFLVRSPIACMRSPRRLRARSELKRGIEARNIGGSFCGIFGTSVLSKSTSSALLPLWVAPQTKTCVEPCLNTFCAPFTQIE